MYFIEMCHVDPMAFPPMPDALFDQLAIFAINQDVLFVYSDMVHGMQHTIRLTEEQVIIFKLQFSDIFILCKSI